MLRKTSAPDYVGRVYEIASMRPQRNAAENPSGAITQGASQMASMRPQRNAAENAQNPHRMRVDRQAASMRPQRNAAENIPSRYGPLVRPWPLQ